MGRVGGDIASWCVGPDFSDFVWQSEFSALQAVEAFHLGESQDETPVAPAWRLDWSR